jgi:hypothetical protein
MDSKNFAIGVLSTTATILLVGVVLLYSRPDDVRADGMTASGGGYVVTVGNLTQGDEELIYVVDASTDKMIVYRFDGNRRQIELVQGVDLAELKRGSTPADPQQPVQPKPRTRQP